MPANTVPAQCVPRFSGAWDIDSTTRRWNRPLNQPWAPGLGLLILATKLGTAGLGPRRLSASLHRLRLFGIRQGYKARLWSQRQTAEPVWVTWHRGQSPGADPKGREGPIPRVKGRPGGGGAALAPGIPCRAAPSGDPVYSPPPVTGPRPAPCLPVPRVRALASDLSARGRDLSPEVLSLFLTPSFHPEEPGTCPGEPTSEKRSAQAEQQHLPRASARSDGGGPVILPSTPVFLLCRSSSCGE